MNEVVKLIDILVWPIIVVFLGIKFSKDISEILKRIISIKNGDTEISFSEKIFNVYHEASLINVSLDASIDRIDYENKNNTNSLVDMNSIPFIWNKLENKLRNFLVRIDKRKYRYDNISNIFDIYKKSNIFSDDIIVLMIELYQLKDSMLKEIRIPECDLDKYEFSINTIISIINNKEKDISNKINK